MPANHTTRGFSPALRALLLCATALACAAVAQAQNAVEARVIGVSGAAMRLSVTRLSKALASGDLISPGDEVDTRGGGQVTIEMTDGSAVIVRPGSRVVMRDYRSASNLRELFEITLGKVRVKINHYQGRPNPYRVNSPTASIAVRGTEFAVAVEARGDTRVVVYEGLVEVASRTAPQRRALVQPGRGVIVRPNQDIRFFTPGPGDQIGERNEHNERGGQGDQRNSSQSSGQNQSNGAGGGQSGSVGNDEAGEYERYTSRETEDEALPFLRFLAFPDSHLDSLANPAYAGEFTSAEGRVFLLPSFSGTRGGEDGAAFFGLRAPRPVDYSFSPQASFFAPLPRWRAVVGGSATLARNGFQSFSADEGVALTGAPFPSGATGLRADSSSTTKSDFIGSAIFARRFGDEGRTSVGASVERLTGRGSFLNFTTQTDDAGLTTRDRLDAITRNTRTRFTLGFAHDFNGGRKLGLVYRYETSSADDRDRSHTLDAMALPLDLTQMKGRASEIGLLLRGPLTRKLFYGVEGTLRFAHADESLRRAVSVDSRERDRLTRGYLGFGLGYALRPRTVLSFDVAGGYSSGNARRFENATGNVLEEDGRRARFLSLHAGMQTDVWRNLFVGGSFLYLLQSRKDSLTLYPDRFGRRLTADGLTAPNGLTRDRFGNYYSNFSVGWRFTPNFLAAYVFSTDYGLNPPGHTLLLRYTFNIGGK
ncbi:MAG: FecR domain-containing protein [Blastocatellales bacterium]